MALDFIAQRESGRPSTELTFWQERRRRNGTWYITRVLVSERVYVELITRQFSARTDGVRDSRTPRGERWHSCRRYGIGKVADDVIGHCQLTSRCGELCFDSDSG